MDAKLLAQIKTQFRRHMNGTTASLMRRMDDSYKTNYGLSLQHVREVAAMFELSPDDCDELWQSRWREMMLVALSALGPDRADVVRLLRWASAVSNQEMVENFAFVLSGRVPCALSFCRELVIRNEGLDLALAAHTAGRVLSHGLSAEAEETWSVGLEYIFATATACPVIAPAAASALSYLCRQALRQKIAVSVVEAFVAYAEHKASAGPDGAQSMALARLVQEYLAEKELFG